MNTDSESPVKSQLHRDADCGGVLQIVYFKLDTNFKSTRQIKMFKIGISESDALHFVLCCLNTGTE